MSIAEIPTKKIRGDGGTQMRAEIDDDFVDELVEFIEHLPPIVVFYDGTNYWLADGFHRLAAHLKAGKKMIYAEVQAGTCRDAILFAVGANAKHGLHRTAADKRRAVEALLRDAEWGQWKDREVARATNVSHPFVASVRRDLCQGAGNVTSNLTKVSVGGKTVAMPDKLAFAFNSLPESDKLKVMQQEEERANKEAQRRAAVAAPAPAKERCPTCGRVL